MEEYARKKKEGGHTCLRHTPRWLAKSGEKFSDPLPCMFLLGEKLLVVRSCECSVSVVFRPSVAGGMRVFTLVKSDSGVLAQGYSFTLRPAARME